MSNLNCAQDEAMQSEQACVSPIEQIRSVISQIRGYGQYEGNTASEFGGEVAGVNLNLAGEILLNRFNTRTSEITEDLYDPEDRSAQQHAQQLLRNGLALLGEMNELTVNRILYQYLQNSYEEEINGVLEEAFRENMSSEMIQIIERMADSGFIEITGHNIDYQSVMQAFWSVLEVGYSRRQFDAAQYEDNIVQLQDDNIFSRFMSLIIREVFVPYRERLPNLRSIYNDIARTYNRELDDDFPEVAQYRRRLIMAALAAQSEERLDALKLSYTRFLEGLDQEYVAEYSDQLQPLYFGVHRNMSDTDYAHILQNENISMTEYVCPPWNWEVDSQMQPNDLTHFHIGITEPERRQHRLGNVIEFLSATRGCMISRAADVQIPLVWRANPEQHLPNILQYTEFLRSAVGDALPEQVQRFDAGLISEVLGDECFRNNYTIYVLALACIFEGVSIQDLNLDRYISELILLEFFDENIEISEQLRFDINSMHQEFRESGITNRQLNRYIETELTSRRRTAQIDRETAALITLREMALELATYQQLADQGQVVVEEYDSLAELSPYAQLAQRLLGREMRHILLPVSRTIPEAAVINIAQQVVK